MESKALKYVCVTKNVTNLSVLESGDSAEIVDFDQTTRHYTYFRKGSSLNFDQAMEYCKNFDKGTLAVMKNEADLASIKQIVPKAGAR